MFDTFYATAPDRQALVKVRQSEFEGVLTPEALEFLTALHRRFDAGRLELLAARQERQKRIDRGEHPRFLTETSDIRNSDWTVAPVPQALQDRRVEITGPTERKMVINALNSGARVFMADFEDSLAPSWHNVLQGQVNLSDAIRGTITYDDPQNGKTYRLNPETAVLLVRPRGLHLSEQHILIDGVPMSGSLFDFGLYFFHNAVALLERGRGPYFYLPKLESHLEARWWNEVFRFAQQYLRLPQGTIKATVLIETILAAFELDEILWELREHSAGLNCGRWDYIFSVIKKFRNDPAFILPDRAEVTMTSPFMRAYSLRVIQVCHRRGCHAIGGMAAQIPIKNNPEANEAALAKVRADKLREVTDGHDGTWVAHPGLVPIALDIFNEHMRAPNQVGRQRDDYTISEDDLLEMPAGAVTEGGVRQNINVSLLYLENWLRGNGCVALYNLMEDAATAEISRSQLWQWLRNRVTLSNGKTFDQNLYQALKGEELLKIRDMLGDGTFNNGKFPEAEALLDSLVTSNEFQEFLTLQAYRLLED
ncbi:MAG TPA: malate synthase A [Saprospiraceae bacterium]|nr:malate synthase A [Saprospiraceae bacterium]HPI05883.1 malate synthase A [Saprospiraceae bacterium]